MAATVQRPTMKGPSKRKTAAGTDEEDVFKSSVRDFVATAVFVFISSIFSQVSWDAFSSAVHACSRCIYAAHLEPDAPCQMGHAAATLGVD